MNRKTTFILSLLLATSALYAQNETKATAFRYAGPVEVHKPILSDSVNVQGKRFEEKNLINAALSFDLLNNGIILHTDTAGKVILPDSDSYQLHLLSFYLNSDRYTKGTLQIDGPGNMEVFVNREKKSKSAELTLEPRRYEVVVKYLTMPSDTSEHAIGASFKTTSGAVIDLSTDASKRYTMDDMLGGKNYSSISVSPNGKMLLVRYSVKTNDGKTETQSRLLEQSGGKVILQGNGFLNSARWMPASNKLFYTRTGLDGTELVTLDPLTMQETVIFSNLPKGCFSFSPDETFLLFSVEEEGPKEGPDLVRVLEPSDRLPGFRTRSLIWKLDLKTGLFEQLTYGYTNTYINDVSADSRYLLFTTSERVYTSRPHSRNSLYQMDLKTFEIDTIWESRPFVNRAVYSPDGKTLLVSGSADAFNGAGLNINEGQISNTYDGQLFLYDPATGKVTALTRDFDPSVGGAIWNKYDGMIYLTAEDKDYQPLFICNPKTGVIRKLDIPEDIINSFTLADQSSTLFCYGQSVSNSNRLYVYDVKNGKCRLFEDLSAKRLQDVALGKTEDWNFTSDDGTTITGRYYLPPNFDPEKKYPMIVYYYGGTSPTNRALESRYSMHMYAALGYVVYTLNPSGTTGFGQEFSSRHVNAWGKMTADEIIRGTELFCEEHPFVDKTKIGCIGASYGGFMTQYLQTRTDLFAAAVSNAGISALSSYWGEGCWGYGYCSVANADSYPWNNAELFTVQSPLFNADKINTPLLLLHGSVDTNVPVGESIQMFAALKILGKEVEFIQVEGENHGIVGHRKRIGWQNSIYAWFDRWLKDQPDWWNELYPERNL